MTRKPRIHFPGALYHVIARGNRRQKIFVEDEDRETYLHLLREYKRRYGFKLYAYVLMPDHLHLLIEIQDVPLARLMQGIQFRYSRGFNVKHGKYGHLFQGRYQAIVCQKGAYLLPLSAYIHLNPVRAGLVEDPGECLWSSYRDYVNSEIQDSMVDAGIVMQRLAGARVPDRKAYAGFVREQARKDAGAEYYEVKDQSFLGSDAFVDKVKKSLNKHDVPVYDLSLADIVRMASRVLEIPPELFYSVSRNRKGAWGRSVAGFMARKLAGYQVKVVAEHFSRDPTVISQGISRVEQRLRDEEAVLRDIVTLEKALMHRQ
jgi:putative transposase